MFIVLVYKKRVSCHCSNGPTAQRLCMARLMLGKHKTTAYVVISELEDYGTMPLTQLPQTVICATLTDTAVRCHQCSLVMSRVVLPAKLINYIYYD